MLFRCLVDNAGSRFPAMSRDSVNYKRDCVQDLLSSPKEYCHDEGMRKSDFDAVNEPVPRALDDCKDIVKSRIVQNGIEAGHRG